MNPALDLIMNRKSVRAYEAKAIGEEIKNAIITATLRAPTAGGMMLYSIIDITDPTIKETLAKTCDNQPFIAKAPLVLLFLADYQCWYDFFIASGVREFCGRKKEPMRCPEEGDLFLACCDAIIAAQTAVIAAESFGIGSCYIGDIMENYETHKALFILPQYVFPICMLCFGYSTKAERERKLVPRFDKKFISFNNKYKRFDRENFEEIFKDMQDKVFQNRTDIAGTSNIGQLTYQNKFNANFSKEMSRSVRAILKAWVC